MTEEPHDRPGSADSRGEARHKSLSLEFGLSILRHYREDHLSARIADVSDALGRPRPTTHRYMVTLIASGMLEQRDSRDYWLSAKAADFGFAAIRSTGIRDAAEEELSRLCRRTGCTARIAVRLDLDALLLHQARSMRHGQSLHAVNTRPGAVLPGHCTALGRALTADLAPSELPQSLRAAAQGRLSKLDRVRLAGYAVEDEEHEPGVCAVAAPVRDRRGRTIAAIDLVGCAPEVTLPLLLDEHRRDILESAAQIEAELEQMQAAAAEAAASPARRRR